MQLRARYFLVCGALCTFVFFAAPAVVRAQAEGTVSGVILGDQGRLGGATITLTGPVTKTLTSAADGSFSAGGLPAGIYRLTVVRGGYRTAQDTVVVTAAGTAQPLFVTLDSASLTSIQTIGKISTTSRAVALNTTPAAVTVLSSQAYQDRAQFQVQNLLEEQPGVELTRASSGGAPGANTNVAIRGADPYETQTLVDGHPVDGGAQGTFLIQFLNPLILNDVEVTKGPGATPNTIRNAIGGSVNFRTPSITPKQSAKVTLGYDTYNGSTEGIVYSNTLGKIGFLAGYARYGTNGYYDGSILSVAADGQVGKGSVPNATINQSIPSSELFNNKSEVAKLGYNFSPSTNVTFGYLGSQSYVDYTATLTTVEPVHIVAGPCMTCAANNGFTPDNGFAAGTATYNNPAGPNLAGQTVLASTTSDNLYLGNYVTDNEPIFSADFHTTAGPATVLARYFTGSITRAISDPQEANQIIGCLDPTCAGPNTQLSGPYYQRETDVLHGADLEFDAPIGRDTVTLAYDTYTDRSTACSGSSPLFPGNDCFLSNLAQFSNTLSVRGTIALGDKTNLTLANYFSNTSQVGSRYDPRLGIVVRPNSAVAVRASAGTSYAAPYPNIATHLSKTTLYTSQVLKPESSFGYDVGGDIATSRTSKIAVDLYNTVIHNRFASVSNRINGTINGLPFKSINFTYNQANTRDAGVEFAYVDAPRSGLGANVDFDLLRSYTYGTNFLTSPFAAFTNSPSQAGNYGNEADGAQAFGYPYSHGRLELNYTFASQAKVSFGATVYGADNSFSEPGFSLFDAGFTLPLQHGLQLTLTAQNVFNHDTYRTLGEYNYGLALPQDAGAVAAGIANPYNPQSLYFAPPRLLTLQVSKRL